MRYNSAARKESIMSTHTADYLEAIEHLPEGAMLRLEHITWNEYEQLLEDIDRTPGHARQL